MNTATAIVIATAIATATTAITFAITAHAVRAFHKVQSIAMGHSDRCIRGNGWMLLDGEYMEV